MLTCCILTGNNELNLFLLTPSWQNLGAVPQFCITDIITVRMNYSAVLFPRGKDPYIHSQGRQKVFKKPNKEQKKKYEAIYRI